ncbi:MAG TPA: response regulator [Gemmatimonadales bacterium]|nr:response regulator [Gemmatimonadales bacterium]
MPAVEQVLLSSRRGIRPSARLAPDQDRTGPAQSAVTIMVVDDDDRVRRVTARMLRDEGYDVLEARSGEQALEQLAGAEQVQIVLTDIAMPGGMNGVELAEKVLAEAPWRRIVLMSGYDRLFPKWGSIGARFPLLMKPFKADQLIQQMSEVLKRELH